ncbi:phasin family protein [Bradyrhizobium sp. CCBAU 51753]|uniref:phasin family protein n=1 Tax=Bradyrhizobium sp. CCBAU 51753 TaxID=1325100 RepID=UPI001FEF99E6|nr:phasin family protein [Bradyrhizobium sp. CCBAU 51753]
MSESEMKDPANGTNVFGMPLFGFPKMGLPGVVGDLADQGFARARTACQQMAEALDETYSCNARGTADYGLKLIEISHANVTSALDFYADLLDSKSATDVLTLSTEQARKAFAMASEQNKELRELGRKLATETGGQIRNNFARVFGHAD